MQSVDCGCTVAMEASWTAISVKAADSLFNAARQINFYDNVRTPFRYFQMRILPPKTSNLAIATNGAAFMAVSPTTKHALMKRCP